MGKLPYANETLFSKARVFNNTKLILYSSLKTIRENRLYRHLVGLQIFCRENRLTGAILSKKRQIPASSTATSVSIPRPLKTPDCSVAVWVKRPTS